MIETTWKSSPGAHTHKSRTTENESPARVNASARGEEENDCREDHTKDPEESIDAAMQRSGVRIGFGGYGVQGRVD